MSANVYSQSVERKSDKKVLFSMKPLFFIAVLLSTFFWAMLLYSHYQVDEKSITYTTEQYPNVDKIRFLASSSYDSPSYKVEPLDSDILFELRYYSVRSSAWWQSPPPELNFESLNNISTELDNDGQLTISLDNLDEIINQDNNFEYEDFTFEMFYEKSFEIVLNSEYLMELSILSTSHSIDMKVINANVESLNVSTISGSIDILLIDSTIGSVNISSNTGSIDFQTTYTNFNNSVNIKSDTGSINIDLQRSIINNGNFTVNSKSGSIDYSNSFDYIKNYTFITFETITGSINININGYLDNKTLIIYTKTDSGSININSQITLNEQQAWFASLYSETGSVNFNKDGNYFEDISNGTQSYYNDNFSQAQNTLNNTLDLIIIQPIYRIVAETRFGSINLNMNDFYSVEESSMGEMEYPDECC